jgi:hypothetical protein
MRRAACRVGFGTRAPAVQLNAKRWADEVSASRERTSYATSRKSGSAMRLRRRKGSGPRCLCVPERSRYLFETRVKNQRPVYCPYLFWPTPVAHHLHGEGDPSALTFSSMRSLKKGMFIAGIGDGHIRECGRTTGKSHGTLPYQESGSLR